MTELSRVESKEGKRALAYGLYKGAIEIICTAVDLYAKASGDSKAIADVTLFEFAKYIKMKPEGRAAKFLDHFLFGNGKDIYFDSAELLIQDLKVRKKVSDSILAKLASKSFLLTTSQINNESKKMCGSDGVITIKQSDYANSEWLNALGTFPLQWELVNVSSDRVRFLARIWGGNEYKWHPVADRVTQCIHEAGDRLTRSKEVKAQNFWMVAKPTIIVVSTGMPIGR